GGEEEFPDAFAEIIGGVKFKNRVTDQKIEHFRRKFAGHKRKKGSVGKSLVALPRRFAPAIERALEDRSSDHLPARSSHGADAEFSAPATTVYRPVGTNGNVSSLGVQISRADDLALKLLRVLPVEVQAGILAGSLYETGNGSSKTSYNDIFLEGKECSQMERNRIALGALVYADKAERFWQGLRTAHRDTLPSVFLAHYGLLRGDDIALVDAKPNKDAHRDLLQMVNYGLGAQIPNSNSYFLLDEGRNVRLHRALESRIKALKIGESKASEMKTHPAPWFAAIVAVDFLRGFYIDADGAQRALQQQYDRVVLYHPDKETRELTRVLASEAEVKHR
ncbi:MAG: hypothetical protein KDD53_12665, partial [Bdellovibrionales bacterium]|nr:hypothetical protein [Bdellovibrionales bacterium]